MCLLSLLLWIASTIQSRPRTLSAESTQCVTVNFETFRTGGNENSQEN